MHYSYHCRHCGYTHLANDKAEIKLARDRHKARFFYDAEGNRHEAPKCVFVKTTTPTGQPQRWARPQLAAFLNGEIPA